MVAQEDASFVAAMLAIFAVGLFVVIAFALPHLRAGHPFLTPRGTALARRCVRPLVRALGPLRRLRPLLDLTCEADALVVTCAIRYLRAGARSLQAHVPNRLLRV